MSRCLILLCLCGVVVNSATACSTSDHGGSAFGTRIVDHMMKLEKLLKDQDTRLSRLEDENYKLTIGNQDLQLMVSDLSAKNLNLEAAITGLQAENQKLSFDISGLKRENGKLKESVVLQAFKIRSIKETLDWVVKKNYKLHDDNLKHPIMNDLKTNNSASRQDMGSKPCFDPTSCLEAANKISTRSDDMGPLEPVVTQMAQQLTEITADLQANKADIQALKNADQQHNQAIQEASSSIYVRWGRSVCPSSAQIVYSGVVGGSSYAHSGAAANHLCLSMSPVFSSHATPSESALLYGGEYQTSDAKEQKDPVCVVCRSHRPTVIMLPGTNVCLPGWTQEYSGFLMAGRSNEVGGTEYICVDSVLEDRVGSDSNQNGNLLFYTLTRCGSLPCGPYSNNKVVTCAVCSK